jgi:activator of HSP90 ATPase
MPISLSLLTRRAFSKRFAAIAGGAVLARTDDGRHSAQTGDVSHAAESIHQEVLIDASRTRVYEALIDAKRFSAMTVYSMVPKAPPATIVRAPGGEFALFGGHIVGRIVELVPNQRIVQAWRTTDWEAGAFSIAHFEFADRGTSTTITFDHTGFPAGLGQHLADGWRANYWTPLRKYLT